MTEPMEGKAVTEGGLFVSNELENPKTGATADTPCKAQPIGRLQPEDEEISSEARNVVEIVCDVDEDSLIAYEADPKSKLERTIERKRANTTSSEIVICFWRYSGPSPISKTNAQRMVKLSEEYSDILMPPLQFRLLQSHVSNETRIDVNQDDDMVHTNQNHNHLRLYRIGAERYLEAAEDANYLVGAPIPFLPEEEDWMETRIADYEEMGIDLLSFNFLRKKPTSPSNHEAIRNLVGYMRRIDYFDATMKYAINVCHSWDGDGFRSAEDIALACMGMDIIGENHWFMPYDYGTDYDRGCRIFDQDELKYHEVSHDRGDLTGVWPTASTKMDLNHYLRTSRDEELKRQERLLNAEQAELLLRELRSEIRSGDLPEFLQSCDGYEILEESLEGIADEYRYPQSSIEDYT